MENNSFEELTLDQANYFINEILNLFNFSPEAKIIHYIGDNEVTYYIYDVVNYHDKPTKKITPISERNYISLLKQALRLRGFKYIEVKQIVEDGQIRFRMNRVYSFSKGRQKVK